MTRSNPEADFPCDCGLIDRAANEPSVPIVFDDHTNEYHLVYAAENSSSMVLYYCFFCGGRLPESRRDRLFAKVTMAEEQRLRKLTKEIKTIDDAIRILGEPDFDLANGLSTRTADCATEPTEINSYRTITFAKLSETAEVTFIDYRERGVAVQFTGKYLGGGK